MIIFLVFGRGGAAHPLIVDKTEISRKKIFEKKKEGGKLNDLGGNEPNNFGKVPKSGLSTGCTPVESGNKILQVFMCRTALSHHLSHKVRGVEQVGEVVKLFGEVVEQVDAVLGDVGEVVGIEYKLLEVSANY